MPQFVPDNLSTELPFKPGSSGSSTNAFLNGRDINGNPLPPEDGESFSSWYKRVSAGNDPNSLWSRFANWFTGDVDSLRDYYSQWYNELQISKQAQADYEYNRLLRQTEYADLIKSLSDAGLNPYVMLSNGASAGSSSSINTSPNTYSHESKKSNTALVAMLYAIARVMVAVLK